MLYVFQVDQGVMFTLDMNLTMGTVQNLKQMVEKVTHIPAKDQAILISGGQALEADERVCSYVAGTDTNPFFVFNTNAHPCLPPLLTEVYSNHLEDFAEKVRKACELPPTFDTIVKRTILAEQFYTAGQEQKALFDKLVYEQHIQHQGWAAVVANMEDLCSSLQERLIRYCDMFEAFLVKYEVYLELTESLKNDLLTMSRIRLLKPLRDLLVPVQESNESIKEDVTLLDFISNCNDRFGDELFDKCAGGLEQLTRKTYEQQVNKVQEILSYAMNPKIKEICGLEARLSGLEQLGRDLKACLDEQYQLMQTFLSNRNSAETAKRDPSISAQLGDSHVLHLPVLRQNHDKIMAITERCIKAKNELIKILHQKCALVMYIESQVVELDHELVLTVQRLKNLEEQFRVLKQVHEAPVMYLQAITEVVRRRAFSKAFLTWADHKAIRMMGIHNEEVHKRQMFQALFHNHFLNMLFPGMKDMPPEFFTRNPEVFDSGLPQICDEEVEELKKELPVDLAVHLEVPDMTALFGFFQLALNNSPKAIESKDVDEKLMRVVAEVGVASTMDQNLLKAIDSEPVLTTTHGLPHLKDLDKGCESETDTEEFEKVGQSPFELHFDKGIPAPSSSRPGTQDASTLTTEDNLQISRSEYEKLLSDFQKLWQFVRELVGELRQDLANAKNQVDKNRDDVVDDITKAGELWLAAIENVDKEHRETLQRLTIDHEFEVSDFRKMHMFKNEELKALKDANIALEAEIQKMSQDYAELNIKLEQLNEKHVQEIDELQKQVETFPAEKERCVKEVSDRLKCEYRGELENIRARFKLMTMERSPSENSLEKIERGDCSSITNTEALLMQMHENFESEKETAVSVAVDKETEKWKRKLEETIDEVKGRCEAEKDATVREVFERVSEEKERLIDQLREQVRNLSLECTKHKNTIMQLMEREAEPDLNETIETLMMEKSMLEAKLSKFKTEGDIVVNLMDQAMEISTMTSTSTVASSFDNDGKVDAATSPIKVRRSTETSTVKFGQLSVDTCNKGDKVFILWDADHSQFRVLQDRNSLHFLHSDSLPDMGLKLDNGKPNRMDCYGIVVDKEYCHAKKQVNRFKVPMGTKFFRVKVKPLEQQQQQTKVAEPLTESQQQQQPQQQLQQQDQSLTERPMSTSQQQHDNILQQVRMAQSQTPATSISDYSTTCNSTQSLPTSPTRTLRLSWSNPDESGDTTTSSGTIPEEKGDASCDETVGEFVEKATELTENYQIQPSIDR